MKTRKQERLEDLIKEELGNILIKVIDDFSSVFITIMRVNISGDLMNAKVFYSVLGSSMDKEIAKKLFVKHKSRLRFELGNRIPFRRVPVFFYEYDDINEKAEYLEKIILNVSQDIKTFEAKEELKN